MSDSNEKLSKEEGKWIKRKIDRVLKDFDNLTRSQLRNKLSLIARHVSKRD